MCVCLLFFPMSFLCQSFSVSLVSAFLWPRYKILKCPPSLKTKKVLLSNCWTELPLSHCEHSRSTSLNFFTSHSLLNTFHLLFFKNSFLPKKFNNIILHSTFLGGWGETRSHAWQSFCLSLLSAGITDLSNHSQPLTLFKT